MNQSSNILNKQYEKGSTSIKENIHSIMNGTELSLQSFVNDIPFEFNHKYRTIILSDIDIPDYDRNKLYDILSKSVIDFTLENKVLMDALEDLKRKKQQIQSDTLSSVNPPTDTSIPVNNVLPSSSFRLPSVRDIYWPSINKTN